jgi:hypothetical protein
MSKPVIFTISAAWDDEASVWSGHCDDIPAAADAATLDELLAKISAMALDLLPDNHPGVAFSPDHCPARSRADRGLNGPAIRQSVARPAARRAEQFTRITLDGVVTSTSACARYNGSSRLSAYFLRLDHTRKSILRGASGELMQKNLLEALLEKPQRETSGSDTTSRFDYQKNWVFCEMLRRHMDDA